MKKITYENIKPFMKELAIENVELYRSAEKIGLTESEIEEITSEELKD